MGICWSCGSDIKLKKDEKHCNNCGEEIIYRCWYCKNEIKLDDVPKILESKECSWCGFFFCPSCKRCGDNCDRPKWMYTMKHERYKISEIIQYLGNVKKGKFQSICPKNVPWSYAKNSNRLYLLKMLGYRVKSKNDIIEYKNRYDEIIDQGINSNWTINDIRVDGTHGIENRETCNLATCFGHVKHDRLKKKDSENIYSLYTRINGEPCEHFDDKNLVIKFCDKCETIYDDSETICPNDICKYVKGVNKGNNRLLKVKISNKKICKLHRNEFIQKKEVYNDESI